MQEEEDKEQKRNMMVFFIVTLLIMLGYSYFFPQSVPVAQQQTQQESAQVQDVRTARNTHQRAAVSTRTEKVETIKIENARISGTVSTKGLKFNNIILKDYKEKYYSSEKVSVFGGDRPYFASSGWIAEDPSVILPDENSCWSANQTTLTPDSPVVLTWDNGDGLLFMKTISLDDNFVFTITDSVKNYGSDVVKLKNTMTIHRELASEKSSESFGFYNGPIGYLSNKLQEVEYEDMRKKELVHQTQGGWFGITDKYWLVSFVLEQNASYNIYYRCERGAYVIESRDEFSRISPSSELSKQHRLFVGAKEINTLDMYEEKLGVPHFDLVIDFGYLYILTKPLLYAISYVKDLVGNMGLGILLITLLLRLLLFPLANKSYRAMNKMRLIQPKIKALQQRYANDQMKLGQAVSDLYKREKVNPLGGCLPVFLQWPILFALYKVLYISIEMRQAPFFGWIHDLSIADPWSVLNLGGLIPLPLPGFLQIGIWPLLMGLSMFIQQKMSPTSVDPSQEKVMLIMPIMFTFMFAQLPSGLVIYWTFSNLLAILQQYFVMKLDDKKQIEEVVH